ncbi:MAG: glycosyltransferase, partial [Negativicutes bacterium]|nr:glycosyltransferase [Negativicutes bacterium]
MRVLILFSQPWRVGGAETHVEALIRGLVGHKIVLAVNRGSDFDKLRSLQEKCHNIEKIIEIQSRGINIFRWASDIAKLAKMILEYEIEVISAHQRTSGLWAYLLKLLTETPFIVTMHDAWHRALFKRMYAKLFPTVIIV